MCSQSGSSGPARPEKRLEERLRDLPARVDVAACEVLAVGERVLEESVHSPGACFLPFYSSASSSPRSSSARRSSGSSDEIPETVGSAGTRRASSGSPGSKTAQFRNSSPSRER